MYLCIFFIAHGEITPRRVGRDKVKMLQANQKGVTGNGERNGNRREYHQGQLLSFYLQTDSGHCKK